MPAASGAFWYTIYNIALYAGSLVCLPFWLYVRFFRGRYRGQFKERMGLLPDDLAARFDGRPAVWVHAASAGETASAAPLVRRLKERFPDAPFLFTVTSRYGKEMATRRLADVVDGIAFSPLDLPIFVARFLRRVRPCLYVMVETDLWPNIVRKAQGRGARVAIASGHARPRSFPRSFWRAVFRHIDLLCMQTEVDAANIRRRGAPAERVLVTGNLKFDGSGSPLPDSEVPALRKDFGFGPDAAVFVAGSTLEEDEGPVLDAIATLRAEGVDLHAIVAPRRQERVGEVVRGCLDRGLEAVLRTDGGRAPVLILDTMGELAGSYNLASVAYVGGGLTPDVGLHNLLEPLVCGVPLLFGPHHGKAHRMAAEVRRHGAGLEVEDGASLLEAMRSVLTDQEAARGLAEGGRSLLASHRGAADRTAARIVALVGNA